MNFERNKLAKRKLEPPKLWIGFGKGVESDWFLRSGYFDDFCGYVDYYGYLGNNDGCEINRGIVYGFKI